MARADKARNIVEETKGKVKEAAGKLTGDKKLERKGRSDQTRSGLKQTGEKLKDAADKLKDAAKR